MAKIKTSKIRKFILTFLCQFVLLTQSLAEESFITLASTTSTENSGLLNYILPFFTKKTGVSVRVLIRGTGQALELGRRGDVDVVFVHAQPHEEKFVSSGYGLKRYPIMYNNFILVGPNENPAQIKSSDTAVAAFKKIFMSKSIFVSRGDNSGTHLKELKVWKRSGVDIAKKNYSWYKEVGAGMGSTLNISIALNGYTLSDKATWKTFNNKSNFKILNGGDQLLFNQYGLILVNPYIHPHIKKERGQMFINWLISEEGQNLISSFKPNNEQLFFPNYIIKK